jgi:plastocyanin
VAGLVYFFYGPSGDIQAIDLIAQTYTEVSSGVSGMSLVAQVNTGKPSHLSGTADLTISCKGATTYTGTMGISESQGQKNIPLSQFAIGNGEYIVRATFQGRSSTTTFTASSIIERLNITAYNITRMSNSTIEYGTARMGVRVIFMSNSFESQMAIAGDRLDIEITGGGGTSKYTENIARKPQLNVNYSVPGNGNYTVKATFHNSKVKTDSQYSTFTTLATDAQTNQTFVMVFMPPKAAAGPDQTVQWKLVDGGGKVTLDGSNSIAYGGGRVTNWTWDYGDGYIEEGMKVTYTFQNRDTYIVTLLVSDNNGNTDTDTCTVTVL